MQYKRRIKQKDNTIVCLDGLPVSVVVILIMKKVFEITDKNLITEILNNTDYGVLALCATKPYAVPVNFVYLNDGIYFHGSPKGKKMSILKQNKNVSFNVIADTKIIPSYYSSTDNLACPATTFFKSVIVDGAAQIITLRSEIVSVFAVMMKKLQPEGQYKPLYSSEYGKQFKGLSVIKIHIKDLSAKFKFGQNLNQERFNMIITHLEKNGSTSDILTVEVMKRFYK